MYKGKLKPLKEITTKTSRKQLAKYCKFNLKNSNSNKAEQWAKKELIKLKLDLKEQYLKNYRIFDFYFPTYGVVIEIDGEYHTDPKQHSKDLYSDEQYFRTYGILTLRINNFDEDKLLYIKNLFKYNLIETLKTRLHRIESQYYKSITTRLTDNTKSYLEEELNRLNQELEKAITSKSFKQSKVDLNYTKSIKPKKIVKQSKRKINKNKLVKNQTNIIQVISSKTNNLIITNIDDNNKQYQQEKQKQLKLKNLNERTKKINL